MKKALLRSIFVLMLTTAFGLSNANAALTPVSGNMTVSAHAKAGSEPNTNSNQAKTTTISGYVHAEAMSSDFGDGGGGDLPPGGGGELPLGPIMTLGSMSMADAMADASIDLRTDGFALTGIGHSGVSEGPGHADISVLMTFTFALDIQSSCAIIADNNWDAVFGDEAVSSSISLQDSNGNKLLNLTNPLSRYEETLVLDPGQYTVIGNINCITIAESNLMGSMRDGSGMFGMNLTATAVPEPMTMILLGAGGLFISRKRKA